MPPPPTPLHKRIEARAVAERVLTQLQLNMLEVVSVTEGHDGQIALTLRKRVLAAGSPKSSAQPGAT